MPLRGKAKRQYQREYMRDYMRVRRHVKTQNHAQNEANVKTLPDWVACPNQYLAGHLSVCPGYNPLDPGDHFDHCPYVNPLLRPVV